jgi:hypothetical protein
MAKNNTNLMEPRSLTRTGLWSLHKTNLRAWAEGRCLLEHLDPEEIDALTKDQLVDELMGVLLRAEVFEDRRALATDTVSRPLAELIG